MQVRASGDYKKPHQSGDVRASCAPSAHRRLRRRLRPRRRCAARHCGWDMIRWHIRLSALVSSSHQAPFAVCVCVCLAAILKGKWGLNQGDRIRVNTRISALVGERFQPPDSGSSKRQGPPKMSSRALLEGAEAASAPHA